MKSRFWVIVLLVVMVSGVVVLAGCGIFGEKGIAPGDPSYYRAGDARFAMRYAPEATFPTGLDDEGEATVVHDFWIGETEVTYELWYEVRTWAEENGYTFANTGREGYGGDTGEKPSRDRDHPVTMINWYDTLAWCNALSEYLEFMPVYTYEGRVYRDSQDAGVDIDIRKVMGFRLPTSDEWELAARYRGSDRSDGAIEYPAGSRTYWTPGTYASGAAGPYTDDEATMAAAWYNENTDSKVSQVVGQKPDGGNTLHVYDMSGNVFEWVDASEGIEIAPVVRGGCGYRGAAELQIGDPNPRGAPRAQGTFQNVGLRLVLSLEIDPADEAAAREPGQVDLAEEDQEVDDEDRDVDEQDQDIAFPAGSLVEVEWQGQWYDAQVLETDADRYHISYDGYASSWDEWVDSSRIRDRSTEMVIKSVERAVIAVDHGTDLADVDFPEDIEVRLQDSSTFRAGVRWGPGSYDGSEPGEYAFSGELIDLPANVSNPDNVRPAITVRVRDLDGSTARLRTGGDTNVEGLLYYIEHDDGQHGYYFGTSSRVDLTHVVIEDHNGNFVSMIVFDEDLRPIQWVFEDLTISVVVPRGSEFNPREADHVFVLDDEQVDFKVNIELDTEVDGLLRRIPEVFGSELSGPVASLREALEESTDALSWTVAEVARAAESYHEVSIASFLTVAGAGVRILDELDAIAEGTSTGDAGWRMVNPLYSEAETELLTASASREVRQRIAKKISGIGKHPMGGTVFQMASYLERIASGYYDGHDIEGPAVSMLLCKGASSVPNVCNEFYIPNVPGGISRCVSMCYATLACFTDICHPMMFSVGDALNLRQP